MRRGGAGPAAARPTAAVHAPRAVHRLFQASAGVPHLVNQLALQAMIQAVVHGRHAVDDDLKGLYPRVALFR